MAKNLKLSYIFMFVFSAILIAWQTLTNFFGGVAINYVALLGLLFSTLLLIFADKQLLNRVKDLLIIASMFCVLELIIYFACEFGYGENLKGFIVYQNIISFLGILFLAYICFRFTTEFLNKKFKFVEVMLGNEKFERKKKEKKAKELTNGSLEDKPNNKASSEVNQEEVLNENNENEDVVIVETEE